MSHPKIKIELTHNNSFTKSTHLVPVVSLISSFKYVSLSCDCRLSSVKRFLINNGQFISRISSQLIAIAYTYAHTGFLRERS